MPVDHFHSIQASLHQIAIVLYLLPILGVSISVSAQVMKLPVCLSNKSFAFLTPKVKLQKTKSGMCDHTAPLTSTPSWSCTETWAILEVEEVCSLTSPDTSPDHTLTSIQSLKMMQVSIIFSGMIFL